MKPNSKERINGNLLVFDHAASFNVNIFAIDLYIVYQIEELHVINKKSFPKAAISKINKKTQLQLST